MNPFADLDNNSHTSHEDNKRKSIQPPKPPKPPPKPPKPSSVNLSVPPTASSNRFEDEVDIPFSFIPPTPPTPTIHKNDTTSIDILEMTSLCDSGISGAVQTQQSTVNMVAPPAPPVVEEKTESEPSIGMSGGDFSAFDDLVIEAPPPSSVPSTVNSHIDSCSDTNADNFNSTSTSIIIPESHDNTPKSLSPRTNKGPIVLPVQTSASTEVERSAPLTHTVGSVSTVGTVNAANAVNTSTSMRQKNPMPSPSPSMLLNRSKSSQNVTSKGTITAPKKTLPPAVFKAPNKRPVSLSVSSSGGRDSDTGGDRDNDSEGGFRSSRSKSVHVNILQSAFLTDETPASASSPTPTSKGVLTHSQSQSSALSSQRRRSVDRSAQEDVVKPHTQMSRGVVSHGSGGNQPGKSFNRPRSLSQMLPKQQRIESDEQQQQQHEVKEECGDQRNGLRSQAFEVLPQFDSDITRAGGEIRGDDKKVMIHDKKMKHLLMMNAVDDEEYALESKQIDAAASYRPVSRNCGGGILSSSRMDSFHLKYASDSTDTDDDDDDDNDDNDDNYNEDEEDDSGDDNAARVAAIVRNEEGGRGGGRDSENRKPKNPISKNKKSKKIETGKTRTNKSLAATKTIPSNTKSKIKKRTKKEKLARRAAALEKKNKNKKVAGAGASAGVGEAAPMTEREKRVARYRATLERIDRKLQKEGVGEGVKCVDENDVNAAIRFLLSGRVYGYPGTNGSLLSNYWAFIKQKHPLFSLFLHHKHHPLKTRRRLVIFCCVLFFAFIMSVILLEGFYFNESILGEDREQEFICAGGCGNDSTEATNISTPLLFSLDFPSGHIYINNDMNEVISPRADWDIVPIMDTDTNPDTVEDMNTNGVHEDILAYTSTEGTSPHMISYRGVRRGDGLSDSMIDAEAEADTEAEEEDSEGDVRRCHGGANEGLEYDKYQQSCQYYPPWAISFIAGALITPYDILLKFMATCGCVQGRSFFQDNCCGVRCKGFITNSGNIALIGFVALNILFTLAALYRAYFVLSLGTVLITFILSEIVSFGYWVGWTIPYFSFKFPSDRKVFYKTLRKERKKQWKIDHPNEDMSMSNNNQESLYDNNDSAV